MSGLKVRREGGRKARERVCVCECEGEREREKEGGREKERERVLERVGEKTSHAHMYTEALILFLKTAKGVLACM